MPSDDPLTVDDLERLTVRAIVGMCARAAARARPDFGLPAAVPDRGGLMAAVDEAVRVAARYASGGGVPIGARDVAQAGLTAAWAAPAATPGVTATRAGLAAGVVAAVGTPFAGQVPYRAVMCIRASGVAARASRRDCEALVALGLGDYPNEGRPVDVSEAGPLGGCGRPTPPSDRTAVGVRVGTRPGTSRTSGNRGTWPTWSGSWPGSTRRRSGDGTSDGRSRPPRAAGRLATGRLPPEDPAVTSARRPALGLLAGCLAAGVAAPPAAADGDRAKAVQAYNAGVVHASRGQHAAAIADSTEALRLDPGYVKALNNRGTVYAAVGQPDDAVRDYTEAIRLSPDFLHPYLGRGLAFVRVGKADRAVEDFTAAVRLAPADPRGYAGRGAAYEALGRYDQAVADQTEAIRLAPQTARWRQNRAAVYVKQARYDAAEADAGAAVGLDPFYPEAYLARGVARLGLGRLDDAVDDFTEAARLDPTSVEPLNARGAAYRRKWEFDKAVADHTAAVLLAPGDARGYLNRGVDLEAQGKDAEAAADLADAVRRDPAGPGYRWLLAGVSRKARAAGSPPTLTAVELAADPKVVASGAPAPTRRAGAAAVEGTTRVRHGVAAAAGWDAPAADRGRVAAWSEEVERLVRAEVGRATGRAYDAGSDVTRKVALRAGERAEWVDVYRTGVARLKFGADEVAVPFEFRADADLRSVAGPPAPR